MFSHLHCKEMLKAATMFTNLLAGVWTLMSFILSGALAADWIVHVSEEPLYAPPGSSVVLQCTYDYPEESDQGIPRKVLSEMWCLNESRCITPRYLYHSAGIFPELSYQGRVQYLGQTGSKNCSLMISDLRSEDSGVYVFRFITDHLKAKLPRQKGVNLQVTQQTETRSASSSTTGIVLGVIIMVIIIAGIVVFIRRKSRGQRSRSL
ncbi:sialic acid-binding Ig-like lectin 14 [Garra rufa]|uniref:sialic acid-binding Ig-like lectin 14 n=1 Tax=Garra rufa TaxID=137080 RepID=UPI003CCEA5C3